MLGRPFLDFDDELERRTRMPVAEIFSRHGEVHFRTLELGLTQELVNSKGAILAPGGGWITVPGALALLRPPGRMIYLRVAPEVAILRMGEDRNRRPLLQGPEPVAVLRRLNAQREPAYLQADYVVDTDTIAIELVAAQIARFVAPIGESYV
ncbi:MAG: shikimate kinase [Gemmatimonadaceae bacterium]